MTYYGRFYRTELHGLLKRIKHLPGALGAAEVQAAKGIQASQTLVARAAAKTASPVHPLGLDDRILTDWMRRAE